VRSVYRVNSPAFSSVRGERNCGIAFIMRFFATRQIVPRHFAIAIATAVAITLTSHTPQAAPSSHQEQKQVRSLGYCVRLANARGWTRAGEKGRLPFIRRCMEGKIS
jgi:hypothetical protein